MLIRKFWYWFCILTFLSGLFDLLISKNDVFFKSGYVKLSNDSEILASVCLEINSTLYDCSNLSDQNQSVCENLKEYFEYVESKDDKSPNKIINRFNETNNISTLFKFDKAEIEYKYLNLKHLCTVYKLSINQEELDNNKDFFSFNLTNNYHLSLKLFVHASTIPRYLKIEELDCLNFKNCSYFSFKVAYLTKGLLQSPYETSCVNYLNIKFDFKRFEEIKIELECAQECYKNRYRHSEFFYTDRDTDLLKFNKNENYDLIDENYFQMCKRQCPVACSFKYFIFQDKIFMPKGYSQNYVEIRLGKNALNFEAIPQMDSFTFWRKFLAFICLFFKISVLILILRSKKVLSNFLKNKSIISTLTIILWSFLIACFFYGSYLGRYIVYDGYNKTNVTSFIYLELPFEPAYFAIAICINSKLNRNSSLSELGQPAKSFNSSKNFLIKFDDDERELDTSNGKFFFRISEENLETCFSIDVRVQEPRYRSSLSLTALIIKTKDSFDSVYIEQYNKSFTYHSFKLEENSTFGSIDENYENGEISCGNYGSTKDEKCNSKINCIDKCHNERFLQVFNRLPPETLVYLDDYEEFERNHLRFDFNNSENDTFKECMKRFREKNCKSTIFYYERNAHSTANNVSRKKNLKLNLFYPQIKTGNSLKFNLFQMICSFVSLSTIIIGLNWPKFSSTTVKLINFFLKPEDALNFKNLIFLISLLGFSFHSYFIFNETCLGQIQNSSNYIIDFLNANKKIPDLVICLKHNETFEKNEIKTGKLLDKKTDWINKSYLFKKIEYYDLKFEKQIWTSSHNKFPKNLNITIFFLHNYKCFSIRYFLNNEHPKNAVTNTILNIKFNHNINFTHYWFFAKEKDTVDYSSHFYINFKTVSRAHYSYFNSYYYDQYQTLINPKLWFNEGYKIHDVSDYLKR